MYIFCLSSIFNVYYLYYVKVFKLGLAKSIHHARVLIRQRHIRYVQKNEI